MAAIIAKLLASRRRFKEAQKYFVDTEKSTYKLEPFDERFKPEKHNNFYRLQSDKKRKDLVQKIAKGKGHFFSDHSTLTNRPDAKTQLSLIFLRFSSCFFGFFA